MSSAICFNLVQSKILLSGTGLTLYQMTKFSTGPKNRIHFADDKMKYAKMMIFVFDRVANTVGKG